MANEEADRTLWCGGGLHDRITEEILWELFLQAGPLERVKLVKDRGFSFITFKHAESVPYTIELMNGIPLFGKQLKLQYRSGSIHDAKAKGLIPPPQPQVPGMMGPPMMGLPPHMMGQPGQGQFHRSISSPCMMENPSRHQKHSSPPPWGEQNSSRWQRDRSNTRNDSHGNGRGSDSERSYNRDDRGRSSPRGNERDRQQNYDRDRRGRDRDSSSRAQERSASHDRSMVPRDRSRGGGGRDGMSPVHQQSITPHQHMANIAAMNPYAGGTPPPWDKPQGRRHR